MKILYLHPKFSTPQGSTGTRSYEMARRLAERGHEVSIVCSSYALSVTGIDGAFTHGKREGKVDGIRVIECNRHYLFHSIVLALREPYDLIAATTPFITAIPAILAKLRGKDFVYEMCDPVRDRNPLMLGLEWLVQRVASRLVALSPGVMDAMITRGVAKNRVIMIPNGCDLALFAAPVSAWRPAEVREEDMLVVYAGAHDADHGLEAALNVAAELKRRGADHIKLVFVGDGEAKQTLIARADRDKLGNVLFLNPVPKAKLAGLLAASDLGLLLLANIPAFQYSTSPNKFFDYLASGLPVLCNYPGWVAEMITLHQCGFAVAADNSKAFADALVYAANNRSELTAMGPRAQQLGRTAFSRDQLAEKFCKWLESATSCA